MLVSLVCLEKQMPWAKVCVQVWICFANNFNRTAGPGNFVLSKCNNKSIAGPVNVVFSKCNITSFAGS